MSTVRPFAFNPGLPISGTEQLGDLSIGVIDMDYSEQPGGVQWWNGPDEDLGYVIAHPTPSGNQPNQLGIPAYVGFWRTSVKTDKEFIILSQWISGYNGTPQIFTTASQAKTWLNNNGFWTSYDGLSPTTTTTTLTPGPTTGDYRLLAQYSPANNNGDMTFPNHNAANFSLNPNLVGTAGYAIYINGNDLLGNSQVSILNNLIGNSGTLTLTQGSNSVTYSFTSTAFGTGMYGGNQYYWDNQYNGSPLNTITVISPATGNFNTVDLITITISI